MSKDFVFEGAWVYEECDTCKYCTSFQKLGIPQGKYTKEELSDLFRGEKCRECGELLEGRIQWYTDHPAGLTVECL